jgi:hypothetical protein
MQTLLRSRIAAALLSAVFAALSPSPAPAQSPALDESPAVEGEWGYRPGEGYVSRVNPPSFLVCVPRKGSRGKSRWDAAHRSMRSSIARGASNSMSTALRAFFRRDAMSGVYRGATPTATSPRGVRRARFSVARDAAIMPLPERYELLARIPDTHPRLFVRPENMTLCVRWRRAASPIRTNA